MNKFTEMRIFSTALSDCEKKIWKILRKGKGCKSVSFSETTNKIIIDSLRNEEIKSLVYYLSQKKMSKKDLINFLKCIKYSFSVQDLLNGATFPSNESEDLRSHVSTLSRKQLVDLINVEDDFDGDDTPYGPIDKVSLPDLQIVAMNFEDWQVDLDDDEDYRHAEYDLDDDSE